VCSPIVIAIKPKTADRAALLTDSATDILPPHCLQRHYCFDSVQVPTQPSLRVNVPEPLRPDMCPLTLADKPLPAQTPLTEPLLLTRPVNPSDTIFPPEIATTALVRSEQVRPALAEAHVPSKLPPPPPPPPPRSRFEERSLCEGRSRSRLCEVEREPPLSSPPPETDLSCLPMLPPTALCDSAGLACKQSIAAAAKAIPRIKLATGNRHCIEISSRLRP
jgi:hypothetical protein